MTESRHRLHVVVRDAIDRWNDRAQIMHMGHRIDLGAELTEAIVRYLGRNGQLGETRDR